VRQNRQEAVQAGSIWERRAAKNSLPLRRRIPFRGVRWRKDKKAGIEEASQEKRGTIRAPLKGGPALQPRDYALQVQGREKE